MVILNRWPLPEHSMSDPQRQLWLLRHGATEWALNGRHTGSTDLPLLPKGEQEATALAPILAKQAFAAVFSSPLQRARRTCELAGLGAQMQLQKDILEWDYGDYEDHNATDPRPSLTGRSGPMAALMAKTLSRFRLAAKQRLTKPWLRQERGMLPCSPTVTSSGRSRAPGWGLVPLVAVCSNSAQHQ